MDNKCSNDGFKNLQFLHFVKIILQFKCLNMFMG